MAELVLGIIAANMFRNYIILEQNAECKLNETDSVGQPIKHNHVLDYTLLKSDQKCVEHCAVSFADSFNEVVYLPPYVIFLLVPVIQMEFKELQQRDRQVLQYAVH